MSKNICLIKPTIKRKEMASVLHTLVDENIGPSDQRKEFHSKFAELLNLTSTSVTTFRTLVDALTNALKLCEVGENDKVIVSALSPFYYKTVINSLNAKMVVIDVNIDTGLIDLEEAEKHYQDAKAMILFEPCGNIFTNNELDECPITIIEDISQSILSTKEKEDGTVVKAGDVGQYLIYSLESDSLVTAAGGAVLVSKKYEDRKNLRLSSYSEIALCDVNAVLALVQLTKLNENHQSRQEIFQEYQKEALVKNSHRSFGINGTDYKNSCTVFSVLTKGKSDEAMSYAKKSLIEVERTFNNRVIDLETNTSDKYSNAKSLYLRTISFPVYPFLQQAEKATIIKILTYLP